MDFLLRVDVEGNDRFLRGFVVARNFVSVCGGLEVCSLPEGPLSGTSRGLFGEFGIKRRRLFPRDRAIVGVSFILEYTAEGLSGSVGSGGDESYGYTAGLVNMISQRT